MFSLRVRSSRILSRLQLSVNPRKFSTNDSGLSISRFHKPYQAFPSIYTRRLSKDKFLCYHKIKNKSVFTNSVRYYTVSSALNTEKEPITRAQEASSNVDITNTLEIDPVVNEILDPTASSITVEAAMKIGDLKAMGLIHYTPVGLVETLLEAVHVLTDVPWWGTILIGTLIVRLILVPLSVDAMRSNIKTMNIQPQVKKLMEEMKEARKYSDTAVVFQKAEQMKKLYKNNDASPYRGIVLALIQAPIMISFFLATKKMAEFPVESFKTGGVLWFTDLTIPDPYYVLPVLTTAGFLSIIEIGNIANKTNNSQMQKMRWVIRGITLLSFPITMGLPSSVLLYFTVSAGFSVLQALILNNQMVRTYLKIPKQLPQLEGNSPLGPSENVSFSKLLSKIKSDKEEELPVKKYRKR